MSFTSLSETLLSFQYCLRHDCASCTRKCWDYWIMENWPPYQHRRERNFFMIMNLAKREGHYTYYKDTRHWQIWCILLQNHDDIVDTPMKSTFKILNALVLQLDAVHWECVLILCKILLLRLIIDRRKVSNWSDHHTLRRMQNVLDVDRKHETCRLRLIKYDFDIILRADIKHQAAEALWWLSQRGSMTLWPKKNFQSRPLSHVRSKRSPKLTTQR